MRIALISDIHGNKIALQAVLENIAKAKVDKLFFLGDVSTLGPDPVGSLRLLREQKCPCILGNHDEFLFNPELALAYTHATEVLSAIDWCRDQLSEADIDFVRSFSALLTVGLSNEQEFLLFHGSPRSHMEDILATTNPNVLDDILSGYKAQFMAGGHTHLQLLRQHRGRLIINPGSVGAPFKQIIDGVPQLLPDAEYAIVEVQDGAVDVVLKRVPLDVQKLINAAEASDCPMRDWMLDQYRSW